jgi:hypothetical protein
MRRCLKLVLCDEWIDLWPSWHNIKAIQVLICDDGVSDMLCRFLSVLNRNYEQNSQGKAIWTINLLYDDTELWKGG